VRVGAAEKLELIRLVEGSALSIRQTLKEIGLARSTFYTWYKRYLEGGPEALADRKPRPRRVWNRISDRVREQVIETALLHTHVDYSRPALLRSRVTLAAPILAQPEPRE
jgi:transposase-like protein